MSSETGSNQSINVRGKARVGIASTGANARIAVKNLNLGALPGADEDAQAKIEALVNELKALLETAPPEKQDEADTLAHYTNDLVAEAQSDAPKKTRLQISAKGMMEAAEALVGVIPKAATVVKSIADLVMGMV